jgi:hypothetical protein
MHSLFAGPITLVDIHNADISDTDDEGVWVYAQKSLPTIHISVTALLLLEIDCQDKMFRTNADIGKARGPVLTRPRQGKPLVSPPPVKPLCYPDRTSPSLVPVCAKDVG